MPQIDLITAGMAAAERRAWFARCKAAPIPPLPVSIQRQRIRAPMQALHLRLHIQRPPQARRQRLRPDRKGEDG
jgi:hypothetical protein